MTYETPLSRVMYQMARFQVLYWQVIHGTSNYIGPHDRLLKQELEKIIAVCQDAVTDLKKSIDEARVNSG